MSVLIMFQDWQKRTHHKLCDWR